MSTLVFFGATDGDTYGVWVTDGTPGGTRPLGTPPDVAGLSHVSDFTPLASGQMLFSAYAGELGRELWISDGTAEGTRLVKDILPGPGTGVGGALRPDNDFVAALGDGRAVFTGNDGLDGSQLWVTDGTEDGTHLLKIINPEGDSAPSHFHQLAPGLVLFFATDAAHGREPWITDGTEAGTRLLRDIKPGPADSVDFNIATYAQSWPPPLLPFGDGRAILVADDGTHGREPWITDGTPGGTFLLADVNADGDSDLEVTFGLGPRPDGSFTGRARLEPGQFGDFVTDGTPEGTDWAGRPPDTPLPEPFELGPGEGIYMASHPQPFDRLLMDDGRWLFRALAREKVFDTDSRGDEVVRTLDYGMEPWVSDGTQGGTRLVANINPGGSSGPREFRGLPDGRALFIANDGGGRALWVTDGDSVSKMRDGMVDLGTFQPFATGAGLLSARMLDGSRTLWLTDGTGLQQVGDAVSILGSGAFRPVGDGRWLFNVTNHATDPVSAQTWISDGTAAGTRALTDGHHRFDLLTHVDRDLAIYQLNPNDWRGPEDDNPGREPAVIDLATGQITLLEDIWPGSQGSRIVEFGVLPADVPPPVSTLFDERASMPGEESAFVLDDYFTDPLGGALGYTVTGLPAGVSFDPAAARVGGTLPDTPGIHEVRVTAESAPGVATTASFDWIVPDTGLLRLSAEEGWYRTGPDGPVQSVGGDVLIGHRDGDGALLRISDGGVSLQGGRLAVEGTVWPAVTDVVAPLMQGSFALDIATAATISLEDKEDPDSLALAGGLVTMGFDRLALQPDQVAFATDLTFDGVFAALSTSGAPLSLIVDETGLSFGPAMVGTGRWAAEGVEFSLPGASSMTLGFQNIGLFYDMVSDSLYLNGKASLKWGGAVAEQFSFIAPGPSHKLTLDLAGEAEGDLWWAVGDKYLRIGFAGDDWDWDIVGALSYEGSAGPIMPGWPELKKLTLDLNTPASHVAGGFTAQLPLYFRGIELEAALGAFWDPFQIDSFTFGIDDLNQPLGLTGLFVQGGKLAAEQLAGRDPEEGPTYSAELNVTFGPRVALLPTPVTGSVKGTLKPGEVEVEIALATVVGNLMPSAIHGLADPLARWFDIEESDLLEFALGRVAGTVAMDSARPSMSGQVQATLLNGAVSGLGRHELFRGEDGHLTHVVTQSAEIAFPDQLPLLGGRSLAGSAVWRNVIDEQPETDFVAVWTKFDLPFEIWGGEVAMGLRTWKDGRMELMGLDTIEDIGSWQLGPEHEVAVLSARWEVPHDGVTLELVTPGGVVLSEADIAARDDIAILTALSGPTGRHVALHRPEAGRWDLQVVDAEGLGALRTEASTLLPTPITRIEAVTLDPATLAAEIALAASPPAAAPVTLFAAEEQGAPGGRSLLELGPLAADSAATVTASLAGLAPGSWWLHARTGADGHAPGLHVFDTPLVLPGAADMGIELREGTDRDSGARTLTVQVVNRGERPSGETVLHVDVPDTMLGGSGPAGYLPFEATETRLALPSIAPGATETLHFVLPQGLELPTAALSLRVEAEAWDANPAANMLTWFLGAAVGDIGGRLLARDGTAQSDMALTLRLPDGAEMAGITGADGRFRFEVDDATGAVIEGPAWSAATGPAITTASALEALRMAVGLQASWGRPTAQDFIAADISGDGQVTTADALQILRIAVGLPSDHTPRWIVFETDRDFGPVDRTSVPTDLAPDLATLTDPADLSLTALLTGQVQAWT